MDRTIILVNGPPGSGKDTVGNYLHSYHNYHVEKFAAPIRVAMCGLFGIQDHEIEHLKSQITYGGKTLRQWMIGFSEDFVKQYGGVYCFGDLLVKRVEKSLQDRVVITDSGFQEEVWQVIRYFGQENVHLIRLWRESHTYMGDSRGYVSHPERKFDIYNNGSLPDLYHQLEQVIQEIHA